MLWAVGAWAQMPAQSAGAGGASPMRPNIPPPPPPSSGDPVMAPAQQSAPTPPPPPSTAGAPSTSLPATPGAGPATSTPPSEGVPPPTAGDVSATSSSGEELVRLNVQDADIRDIIKQISLATGRNFILDDGVKGKITIISPKPVTKDEAYQIFLSALAVTGFTTVKGPAGVIKIVKLGDAKSNPIPTYVDSTPYTDSYVTRLIQLKSVKPKEMADALTAAGLISKDGKITYYPSTNTLILTESGTNIDRLMKIIKELDEEGPQQIIEIIPLHNSDASKVAQTIDSLLKEDKQKTASKPGDLEDLEDVSRILPDDRTNSIIVLATKRAVEKVRVIIARLDAKVGSGQEGKIHVYYLKYAKAKTLAETLSSLTAGSGQKQTAAPAAGGAPKIAELEGGVKVTADEGTNSLIVTASAKDFQILIDRVVSKLDVPRRQVYIECVIMELELRKRRDMGVAASGGAGAGAIGFGQTFNAATALGGALAGGGGLPGASGLLGGLISSRTVNLTMVGADGTSKTVSVPAFSAFLTALQTYGDTNIVSTPNILTVDNEEALIEVKRDQPIPSATPASATSATLTQSYTFKEAGLTLKITPQISANNSVLLKVDEELSNFGAPVSFGNNQNIPTSKKRHIKTVTVVSDGQTVVLGGLMEDQINNSQSKVPILGDIPILGFFFKQTSKDLIKNNLLIFLTPHIMNDATDFTQILQAKIEQRNKFIEQNYGRKQRETIKNTIRTHREDLLEFKAATDMIPDAAFPKEYPEASAVTPASASAPKTSKKAPPVYAPPPPPPGVITVPSLTPGSSASTYTPSSAPVKKSTPTPAPAPVYAPPKAAPAPAPVQPTANTVPKPAPVKELNLTY